MRVRTYLSLLPLGAALSLAAVSSAGAQQGRVMICRDGTRVLGRTSRACAGHRGVDARATQAALQAGIRPNGRNDDGRYSNGRTYTDGRVGDGRRVDGRADDAARARVDGQRPDRDDRRHDDQRRP